MNNPYNVKVGQIWQDWDRRFRYGEPIFKKIITVTETHAIVESKGTYSIVRTSKIRLDRFRPNSTGYKFISDGEIK